jgi:hypothetical protein
MTDRELLTLAAKAARIELAWDARGAYELSRGVSGNERAWNPLTDDGDALRLAVKLSMRVVVDSELSRTHAQQPHLGFWATAPHNDDPCAATRRAIVGVAADIGRAMA